MLRSPLIISGDVPTAAAAVARAVVVASGGRLGDSIARAEHGFPAVDVGSTPATVSFVVLTSQTPPRDPIEILEEAADRGFGYRVYVAGPVGADSTEAVAADGGEVATAPHHALRVSSSTPAASPTTPQGPRGVVLRGYDIVISATLETAESAAETLLEMLSVATEHGPAVDRATMMLDPASIYPTESIRTLATQAAADVYCSVRNHGFDRSWPIDVGHADPFVFVIDGHRRLSAALRTGVALIPCRLRAEGAEEVVGGIAADRYFASETSLSALYDWEDAHNFRFSAYPGTRQMP